MTSLLIPYVKLPNHIDPNLDEFTYGDISARARKVKNDLKKGDYVFFHTSDRGSGYITAYYVVDRVLETRVAAANRLIRGKYKNPHIGEFLATKRHFKDDAIVFGDPILSRRLALPLLFDRELANETSLKIPFAKGKTELECISSATRQWRTLTEHDVDVLLDAARKQERKSSLREIFVSTDEIQEARETDIEELLVRNPRILERGLSLVRGGRQYEISPTDRIDLLFTDREGNYLVVELKAGSVGRSALRQVKRYTHALRRKTKRRVRGAIICKDILPAFRSTYKKQRDVKAYYYGWKFGLTPAVL